MQKKLLVIFSLALVVLTAIAMPLQPAIAANGPSDAPVPDVIGFKNVVISHDAVVEHVVVIGGDVTIAGTVSDEVVVINGNLILEPTAQLEKRAFVLGGRFTEEAGAVVKKGIVNLEASSSNITGILLAALLVFLWGFVQLAATFALLIILPALSWGFRSHCRQLALVCQSACGKAVALGLLSGLAFLLLESLLMISIVGMPLALFIGIFILLTAIFGASGVCLAIGGRLAAKTGEFDKPAWLQTLYGTIVVALIANIPFLGPLFLAFILLLGVGLVSLAFLQKADENL
ncbi:hypothetical protein [Sporomusa sphaeroides]|uniref:hypothetical protein n=1 Tax=Sporomusa sphaeroides TaxID=47679 RepID=UPI002BADA43E|nr:hypothetical protein [Sporomusa sphaeroides]HML35185.1 hypothetical protein [Sporomusa sphaeroides]